MAGSYKRLAGCFKRPAGCYKRLAGCFKRVFDTKSGPGAETKMEDRF